MTVTEQEKHTLHYAKIHPKSYQRQPQGKEMAYLTNYMKQTQAERVTVHQLIQSLATGHNAIVCNYEMDRTNSIRFVSSSLILIDIDDDDMTTDPMKVLHDLQDTCTGLFYTHSHGIKGNRYRLIFVLDEAVTNEQDYRLLVDYVLHQLDKKGLPVDKRADNPTQIVRGGRSGYVMNDKNVALIVNELLPQAKEFYKDKLKVMEKRRSSLLQDAQNNPVTYEQLYKMCTTIGHLPSKVSHEVTQQWLQITYALKHCVEMGMITDQEGYELFDIISGGESNEKQWYGMKPRGDVSVATIIHYATEKGYKHNYHSYALKNMPEPIEVERIHNKEYIQTSTIIELLQRKQKLLIESATGSGKTTATMKAFKELANDTSDDFYIFTAPTIVLAEQIAIDHEVICIKGGMVRTREKVVKNIVNGKRIFVSTYDKASELIHHINDYTRNKASFYVVVDEVHKYTEAYNYRFKTINKLEDISNNVTSFIGLTGTPEDVLKTDFNKMIKIDTGNDKSPCSDFRVFTYDRLDNKTKMIESGNVLLTSVIRSVLVQTKLLVFINNKDRIRTISRLLRKEGIKHTTVTSDRKQSATYRGIVEHGAVDDDIQVVLTTTVLSDGITMRNELDWSCLVVSDRQSPIFNPSTIKQISNRFRNQYRYFLLFMRTPNEEYSDMNRFNIESSYSYRKTVADNYVQYLNNEYKGKYNEFVASNIEKYHGIYYKSTEQDATITYNPLFIRHNAMTDKEKYYEMYRNAFIQEVSRLIGRKSKGIFNVNDELKKNGSDLSNLLKEVQQEAEEVERTDAELRNDFKYIFTENIYNAIKYDDDETSKDYFRRHTHRYQRYATLKNVKISDYETCLVVSDKASRQADINKYHNDIEALTHIAVFKHFKNTVPTKAVYVELLKVTGQALITSDFKKITSDLSKTVKVKNRYVSKKDVREALKMFNQTKSRTKNDRLTTLEPLTVESVAEKHGITPEQVKKSILMFVEKQPIQRRKIMLKAVEKEYGIKV